MGYCPLVGTLKYLSYTDIVASLPILTIHCYHIVQPHTPQCIIHTLFGSNMITCDHDKKQQETAHLRQPVSKYFNCPPTFE